MRPPGVGMMGKESVRRLLFRARGGLLMARSSAAAVEAVRESMGKLSALAWVGGKGMIARRWVKAFSRDSMNSKRGIAKR